MVSGTRTPEYSVFQDYYATISTTLTELVTPNDLANRLYAAHLIGVNFKRKANKNILDERDRIETLLTAVHNQIGLNYTAYQKFIDILCDYEQLEELLKSLKSKLSH